jgi:hypothetical protein
MALKHSKDKYIHSVSEISDTTAYKRTPWRTVVFMGIFTYMAKRFLAVCLLRFKILPWLDPVFSQLNTSITVTAMLRQSLCRL